MARVVGGQREHATTKPSAWPAGRGEEGKDSRRVADPKEEKQQGGRQEERVHRSAGEQHREKRLERSVTLQGYQSSWVHTRRICY